MGQDVVTFPKIDVYELEIIFSYRYRGIRILRWDVLRPHTSQDSHVDGERTIRIPDETGIRAQTTNCETRPVEARETLLRRAVRCQRGEPFVAVRALRSSAQLRPEKGGRGEGEEKKKEGRSHLLSTLRAVPEGRDTDIFLRPATLSELARPALRPTCSLLPSTFPAARMRAVTK